MCETYGWTWQELQDTPLHVRRVFWLIQQMKRTKQAQESSASSRHPGMQVIPRG